MTDLTDLCSRAVHEARDDEGVEAYAEEGRRTQVRVRDGEVESLTFSESRGVGVRVISDHRVGYAYAADPDLDEVAGLVWAARDGARFTQADEANVLPPLSAAEPVSGAYRDALAALDPERKVRVAMEVERLATSEHSEVRRVEAAGYGDAVTRAAIASTGGGPFEFARTDAWAFAVALAERDGETQTGYAVRLARDLDDLEWQDAAGEAAERAARLLGGTKPSTERLPVVLDPIAAASFLGVLSSALSAESVLKGRSPLADLVGSEVAGEAVSVVDDGRFPEGPAVAPFDGEGVPTGRTTLIERGTLRGFLHNVYTATRSDERSTGNASRASYRTTPGVGPTNLYLEPGAASVEALLRDAGRAIYVQEMTGLHSGANPVSGEFSVGATGLRVEGGALAAPLREMTIASTMLELLKGIGDLASDLRFPAAGPGAPTVLVMEMTVGGTSR